MLSSFAEVLSHLVIGHNLGKMRHTNFLFPENDLTQNDPFTFYQTCYITVICCFRQQMQEEQDVLRMELKAKDSMLEMAKLEKERLINKFQVEAGNLQQ